MAQAHNIHEWKEAVRGATFPPLNQSQTLLARSSSSTALQALLAERRRAPARPRSRTCYSTSSCLVYLLPYLQALHTLERLQAARAGQPVTPPAALDVTVDSPLQVPVFQAETVDSG